MNTTYVGRTLDAPADITPTQRLILFLLARDADDNGMAYCTPVRRIAQGANISESTTLRTLRRLRDLGLAHRLVSDDRQPPPWHLTLEGPAVDGAEGALK